MTFAAAKLGELTRVDLREVFPSEAQHFTPWLAEEKNLARLGKTIDIELQLEKLEKEVGPYRADILCRDTRADNWVLIENQIEKTDHSHLGQLLTYAGGLEAVTIIWIADRFTEEHRAALDWLNTHTDEGINFFGLEIELWRIGDSPIAPKFNVVCQPNSWSKAVKGAATSGQPSEREQQMFQFWGAFADYMEKHEQPRPQPTSTGRAIRLGLGRSGVHIVAILSTWHSLKNTGDYEIRVEIALNGANAKHDFAMFESHKKEIEVAVAEGLTWHNIPNTNRCRVYASLTADFLKKDLWPQQHEWIRKSIEKFRAAFKPYVTKLNDEDSEDTDSPPESE
jgi:hypothetical protein